MDEFLGRSLTHMNSLPEEKLAALSDEFHNSLRNNLIVFGEHAFRKYKPGQDRRSVLNASLWDVLSTGLARIPVSQVQSRADKLRSLFYELMCDEPFIRSITYGTNSANQVRHRFEVRHLELGELFDA